MVLCFIHVAGMLVLGVGWKGPSVLPVLGLPTRLLGPPHSMWLTPRRMKGHLPVLSKAGACTDMPRFGHVLWVNAITGPGQAQGCGEIDVISWWPE